MIHQAEHNKINIWCLGRELNSHRDKLRGILSPLRLPIPPPRQSILIILYVIFLNVNKAGDIFFKYGHAFLS